MSSLSNGIQTLQKTVVINEVPCGESALTNCTCVIVMSSDHYVGAVDNNSDNSGWHLLSTDLGTRFLWGILYCSPLLWVGDNKTVHLPGRREHSVSKIELAHISAYLLTVLIYILATPKVMENLFEQQTTQIHGVKWAAPLPPLESIISSKCAKVLSC